MINKVSSCNFFCESRHFVTLHYVNWHAATTPHISAHALIDLPGNKILQVPKSIQLKGRGDGAWTTGEGNCGCKYHNVRL